MRPPPDTLKLPAKLVNELGGRDILLKGGRGSNDLTSRKNRRKAERGQKRVQRNVPHPPKRQRIGNYELMDTNSDEESQLPSARPAFVAVDEQRPKPKSILKTTKQPHRIPVNRALSPNPVISKRTSRSTLDKLAEDDAKIVFLEKKLGIKGNRGLSKEYWGEDLDGLLRDLNGDGHKDEDEIIERKKNKTEGDEWLAQKRGKSCGQEQSVPYNSKVNPDDGLGMSADEIYSDVEESSQETSNESDEFEGFDSGAGTEVKISADSAPRKQVRENPYVAPASNGIIQPAQYVPPTLRKPISSDSEGIVRLRRQIQGLVNRLTEANLISLLGDVEKIYRENARQHVTSTLIDLLLSSICEATSLPDTLIILSAGFIAAVYKVIGTDFGAQVIEKVIQLFEHHYANALISGNSGPDAAISDNSKETSNLITLLAELYNFQVLGSNLIFDYARIFLGTLSELNTELLLKLIRASGPQLRQDDPSSLKDIVNMLRPAVTRVGEANLSVRTKFMIETISDLKSNRMKTGVGPSAVTSEHIVRMKRILGTLNSRNVKASEPLRIGLKEILESDKKGKWWLVGARWAGNNRDSITDEEPTEAREHNFEKESTTGDDSGPSDLAELAREQRMNTDIRRAIFITIMSASDYQDADLRLKKLKLKKAQELEIPKVLIHCASSERAYNPYYTLMARKLCGDRRLKMAFQFCLWDTFKNLSENEGHDDMDGSDEAEVLDTRQVVNLAKMYGVLIVGGDLSLAVLKNLNLSYLQPQMQTFIEVLLVTVFLQSQRSAKGSRDKQSVRRIIWKAKNLPQLSVGLQFFLKKVVINTDLAGGKLEKATVKWACRAAIDVLVADAAKFEEA